MYKYFLFIIFLPFILFANNTSFQPSWVNQFQCADFYKEYRLDLDITEDVSERKVDFGIDRKTLIPEKTNIFHNSTTPFQSPPLILIVKKDFINKKILLTENDSKVPIINMALDKVIENIPKNERKLIQNHGSLIIILITSSFIISLLTIIYIRENTLKNKIQKLNTTLEKRVFEESLKNRKKDGLLFKQSKLASMGEMINNIAHQWRQPLNRIYLSIQVIENILKENSHILQQKELVDKKIFHINKNITYMSNTIEDYMNFFHPNKEKHNFCLNSLIKKAISLAQSRDNHIQFDIEIGGEINIYTFENEFLQVLLILLENAIDSFKTTKNNHKYIGIFADNEKENIILRIRDNAGGIPPTVIDKIFEPFFTTKFKGEGSGIGLYMAKMIVEESIGGKLDVYSQNIYTNFKITIKKENTNDKP